MGRICWVPWLRSAASYNHDADLPSENCLSWQRRQRWEAHLITFGLIINSNYQLLQKSGPKLNFWREMSCKSIIVSIKARFLKDTHKSNTLQIEVEFKNITLSWRKNRPSDGRNRKVSSKDGLKGLSMQETLKRRGLEAKRPKNVSR